MNRTPDDTKTTSSEPIVGTVRVGGGWRGKVLLEWGEGAESFGQEWPRVKLSDWERALAEPGKLFEQAEQGQVLKSSKSTMVIRRQLELGQSAVEVVCKLSRRRNLVRRIHGVFRQSRPSRNWKMGWDLLREGIPTAVPVAVLEKKVLGLQLAAGIITLSLLPGKNLEHFMQEESSRLTADIQRQLTGKLANLAGRLHSRGFFHRDLKGVNIFVRMGTEGDGHLYLVDLDGCHHDGGSYRKKVKSLGRLARASLNWPTVGPGERLRFLKLYLEQAGQEQSGWKRWWRNIDSEVHRKLLQRKRRSGSS